MIELCTQKYVKLTNDFTVYQIRSENAKKRVFYPSVNGTLPFESPCNASIKGIPFSNDNYRRPVAPLVFYGQHCNKGSKAQ